LLRYVLPRTLKLLWKFFRITLGVFNNGTGGVFASEFINIFFSIF
jgi:hypothetical protein